MYLVHVTSVKLYFYTVTSMHFSAKPFFMRYFQPQQNLKLNANPKHDWHENGNDSLKTASRFAKKNTMFETIGFIFIFLIARDCHIHGAIKLFESFHVLLEDVALRTGRHYSISIWWRECSRWWRRFAEGDGVKVPSVSLPLRGEAPKSNISIGSGKREQIGRLGFGSRTVSEEKRRCRMIERYRRTSNNQWPSLHRWKINNRVADMHDAKVATEGCAIGTFLVVLAIKSSSKRLGSSSLGKARSGKLRAKVSH
jgi:hypothetical protein